MNYTDDKKTEKNLTAHHVLWYSLKGSSVRIRVPKKEQGDGKHKKYLKKLKL